MKGEKASELDFLEKQTLILTTEMKDKIKAMVEEVERKVQHCQLFVSCSLCLQAFLSKYLNSYLL